MASRTCLIALLVALVLPATAEIHAVLVAGSKGWMNYRHQADIAHAYKLLTEGGVKPENIVTFMYDDIAHDLRNPHKGQLFNKPSNSSAKAVDVYAAVKDHIDYKGWSVNPANFLKVLQGEKVNAGTGRTLTSTSEDDVFVYFADHGGVGSLAFPGLFSMKLLGAHDLISALQTAHGKKLYKRLVFYTEACESGSIFDGLLPSNISAYAVTAANSKESSWGWYCDDATGTNYVMGKSLGVCLGDEFSVRWLENSDAADRSAETLSQQYNGVKGAVTKSHPQNFGDMSFNSDPIGEYQGETKQREALPVVQPEAGVSSRDAELKMLEWDLQQALMGNPEFNVTDAELALRRELERREYFDKVYSELWSRFHAGAELATLMYKPPRDFECLMAATTAMETIVGGWNDYSLQYVGVVSNLCESSVSVENMTATAQAVLAAM